MFPGPGPSNGQVPSVFVENWAVLAMSFRVIIQGL